MTLFHIYKRIHPIALFSIVITLLFRAAIILRRLFFHPLKRFPGPKLAAASTLYRAYFEIWLDGEYVSQASKLHERYGPVVRIAPNVLHFRNPGAFEDIFSLEAKLTKDPDFYRYLNQETALLGLLDENIHRARFKVVSELFSTRWAEGFVPCVQKHVDRLCELLLESLEDGTPVNMSLGLRATVVDISLDFVFDQTPDYFRGLKDGKFDTVFVRTTLGVMDWTGWFARNFPGTVELAVQVFPQWLLQTILPGTAADVEYSKVIDEIISLNLSSPVESKGGTLISKLAGQVNLVELTSDCVGTLFGGVVDIGNMLPFGCFSVSENVILQESLYLELESIWEDINGSMPSYNQLKQLQLLSGVVKECLRMMHGVVVGPPRLVPQQGATIDGHYIPAKSVVTTSTSYIHMNPEVFPEPDKFNPSRWNTASTQMEKSLVPFSKGRRMCPAKEIAIMELYVIFATIFRRFKLEIFETTQQDFEWKAYLSLHFKGRPLFAKLQTRPAVRQQKTVSSSNEEGLDIAFD